MAAHSDFPSKQQHPLQRDNEILYNINTEHQQKAGTNTSNSSTNHIDPTQNAPICRSTGALASCPLLSCLSPANQTTPELTAPVPAPVT